jgi:DNA repair exonuclease SbcCD ATPase subunit
MNINELINEELNTQAMQATIKKLEAIKKSFEDKMIQNPMLKPDFAPQMKEIDAALESFKTILTKDLQDKKEKVGGESGIGTQKRIIPKAVVPPVTTP